jgi:hypothetical protein
MGPYMGYEKHFGEDDWFCEECFDKKLKTVNRKLQRENRQVYRDKKTTE